MWVSTGAYVPIPIPGTPVPILATLLGSDSSCHSIVVQQVPGNTGCLYIMDRATGNKTTGTGVLGIIPAPSTNAGVSVILPFASVTITDAGNAMNVRTYYLDADVANDKALVSVVIL